MKQPKKGVTNDISIDRAEKKLDFKYPKQIRDRLRRHNGFEWGGFRFFPVLDDEDKQHTFDDVYRENTNGVAGWSKYIPEGYICIASSDLDCLLLNKNKDGKIYFYVTGHDAFEAIFETTDDLAQMLDENDLFFKLDSPADSKYFIKLLIYSQVGETQYVLLFHHKPQLEEPNKGLTYSSKVNKGERLTDVVKKEITEIIKSGEWELLRIFDGGTDFDRNGNELVKYNLIIRVSHFDTKGKQFSGPRNAYMTWVDEKDVKF